MPEGKNALPSRCDGNQARGIVMRVTGGGKSLPRAARQSGAISPLVFAASVTAYALRT